MKRLEIQLVDELKLNQKWLKFYLDEMKVVQKRRKADDNMKISIGEIVLLD
jgi:hypothetical protein